MIAIPINFENELKVMIFMIGYIYIISGNNFVKIM